MTVPYVAVGAPGVCGKINLLPSAHSTAKLHRPFPPPQDLGVGWFPKTFVFSKCSESPRIKEMLKGSSMHNPSNESITC